MNLSICDAVSGHIWRAYPWKEATQTYPSIPLQDSVSDYNCFPNFYKLVSAQVSQTLPTGGKQVFDPLDVVSFLPLPSAVPLPPQYIQSIAFIKGLGLIRIDRLPSVQTGEAFQIDGQYQLNHVRVTDPNMYIWLGDDGWPVVTEGMLYHGYKLADKMNAAAAQLKAFEVAIAQFWMTEHQGQGDVLVPEVNLGVTPNWGG